MRCKTTHNSGKNGIIWVHSLEWLFDTNTVLDQNDGSILPNDRLELFCSTGARLNAFVCRDDILEIDILQAWVRRGGNGYRVKVQSISSIVE